MSVPSRNQRQYQRLPGRIRRPTLQATNTANPAYFHKVVDCQWACPAHTPVPEYIRLIGQGRYSDAYMINWVSNVFPGILGRTCDRPCEPACRRSRVEENNGSKPEPVAYTHLDVYKRQVSVVSGHIRGETNTLPLHVEILYNEYQSVAAFAVASLLALLALLTLLIKSVVEWQFERDQKAAASLPPERPSASLLVATAPAK